jgi:hypothetical protein
MNAVGQRNGADEANSGGQGGSGRIARAKGIPLKLRPIRGRGNHGGRKKQGDKQGDRFHDNSCGKRVLRP